MAIVFGFSVMQNIVLNVSAQAPPIAFMGPDIDFGLVFPGEILGKDFYVQASSEYTDPIPYTLIAQVKPRYEYVNEVEWGPASDYCLQNPTDYGKCFPLLCPYLNIVSKDGEGDSPNNAYLKQTAGDEIDYWNVALNVPGLEGEYGCDIKLGLTTNGSSCDYDGICEAEAGEDCTTCPNDCGGCGGGGSVAAISGGGGFVSYCGDGFINPGLGEECDDGNTDDGDGCSSSCKIEGEVLGEAIERLPETGGKLIKEMAEAFGVSTSGLTSYEIIVILIAMFATVFVGLLLFRFLMRKAID